MNTARNDPPPALRATFSRREKDSLAAWFTIWTQKSSRSVAAGGREAPHRTRQKGITLVELLVVMVILSLALGLVVPSMANSYQSWQLRSAGRRTAALFRYASDLARRDGTDLAGYYADHRIVVVRKGSVVKTLEIPASINVKPEKPKGAVFLSTGQILASEPFVIENEKGRRMIVEVGPLPGQVNSKEATR